MTPVYVINLDRQPERWARLRRNADEIGLILHRVSALDRKKDFGIALQNEFFGQNSDRVLQVSKGDICCSLSHVRAWREFLNSNAPVAVILEDDALIDWEVLSYLGEDFNRKAAEFDLNCIKLECVPDDRTHRRVRRPLGKFLGKGSTRSSGCVYRLHGPFLGAGAYWITRGAVLDIFATHQYLRFPIDHFLFNPTIDGAFATIKPGFVSPAPVLHDLFAFESDLATHRAHNLNRFDAKAKGGRLPELRRKLKQEVGGLRRAFHKARGARKVCVEFAGDRNKETHDQ